MADRRSGKNTTHTPLPTGSHKWQIAGQGKTLHTRPCLPDRTNGRSPVREKHYTHAPAYQIAQMADRRSGKNTTHTPLPTGSHKWQIAGQGKTLHTRPCLPDRTNGRSPVREKHYTHAPAYRIAQMADRRSGKNTTHTPLPTRSHKWQIAGQGEIHTMSCCCRHALYTYTCTLYLRVPRTVEVHFRLDTTMILLISMQMF